MSPSKAGFALAASLLFAGACTDRQPTAPTDPRFIVHGVETGNRLRNVGVMVYRVPDDPTWYYWDCSGSLIARRAFLTASHCLTGELNPYLYGISEFGVAFPSRLLDTGDPFNPKLPDGEPVYPGHIVLYPGAEQNKYSDFATEAEWLEYPDLAVVVLDRPVRGIDPVELPPIGWIERHARELRLRLTGLAGYGLTNVAGYYGDVDQTFIDWGIRRFGTLRFTSLTPTVAFFDPAPSSGCYFDSGGPAFVLDESRDRNQRVPGAVEMQL
ncbi:MAG TPA: hypothetical protein VJ816_00210, partial [Gemmatimonadales bacterium]|nr:hypothetical protein [Gemmatimonadales bacterium]